MPEPVLSPLPPILPSPAAPVRMAMVGGGPGAFIGPVHRRAAALDGAIALVAGAFSRNASRNAEAGRALGLAPARVYADADALVAGEAALPADVRAEFVTIVTPNHLHADAAVAALEAGFAVFCEKPLAGTLAEARRIAAAAVRAPLGIAFTYLGYPLVREARALVAAGRIGAVRRVAVSYTQGWLARAVEREGNAQAAWRTDPAQAGAGGALGDIGVHAQSLAEHVSGQQIVALAADFRAAVAGRRLDDDGAMLLRFANGARGTLVASQICCGDENRLSLSVYGETGALHWAQEQPNELILAEDGRPAQRITANAALLSDEGARSLLRLPGGHPEGYIEAFANLYGSFAGALRGAAAGLVAGADLGVRSAAFVEAALASSAADGQWRPLAV